MLLRYIVIAWCFLLSACGEVEPAVHFANAEEYMVSGEQQAAIIELKNLLKKNPGHVAGRMLLGDLYQDRGDHANAIAEYNKALEAGGAATDIEDGLFREQIRIGRAREVVAVLDERESLSPQLQTRLGEAKLDLHQQKAAVGLFTRALQRNPQLIDAHLGLARAAWNDLDHRQAQSSLDNALELDPDYLDIWLLKGEIAFARMEAGDARNYFQTAAKLNGGEVIGQIGLVRVALLEDDAEKADELIKVLEAHTAKHPIIQYFAGLTAFQLNDLKTAENKIREVLRGVPDNPSAQLIMGTIKFRQNNFAQAVEYLARALVLDPHNPAVVKMLVNIHLDRGDFKAAEKLLEPIAAETDDAQLLMLYAVLLERQGDRVNAGIKLAQAVAIEPDVAKLRTRLAINLLATGDMERAKTELVTAIELDQNLFENDQLLVMINLHQGNVKKAEEIVNQLLAKSPENATGYYLLSKVRLAQADEKSALSALQKSFEYNPNFYPVYVELVKFNRLDTAELARIQEQALQFNPQHLEARMSAAEAAFTKGQFAAGKDHLQQAALGHPNNIRPRMALARYYLSQSKLAAARELSMEALGLAPQSNNAQLLLAQVLFAQQQHSEARRIVKKLEENLSGEETNEMVHKLADLQAALGLEHLGLDHYHYLVAVDDYAHKAQVLANVVRLHNQAKRATAARQAFLQLSESNYNPDKLQVLEADLLVLENQPEAAEEILAGLVPAGDRTVIVKLAMVQTKLKRFIDAISLLANWLKEHPNDIGVHLMLAEIELGRGNNPRAISHYESVLEVDERHVIALNNLAWGYLDLDIEQAADAAHKAFRLSPTNPDVLDTVGWVDLRRGKTSAAIGYLKKAIRIGGDSPTRNYHLAAAYQALGNQERARQQIDLALHSVSFPERTAAENLLVTIKSNSMTKN